MIRVLDDAGNQMDEYLLVRYGATPQDWEDAAGSRNFVELIDGMLVMHSPVSLTHARIFSFLHHLLSEYVQSRRLGEVLCGPFTMELTLERKFEPDLMFLTNETRRRLGENRLVGPADLAIEIASRSTRAYDRGAKRECYRVGGVREYWMIDPSDRQVTVDVPAGHEVQRASSGPIDSRLCPGFLLRAEWLWLPELPSVAECLREILAARPT